MNKPKPESIKTEIIKNKYVAAQADIDNCFLYLQAETNNVNVEYNFDVLEIAKLSCEVLRRELSNSDFQKLLSNLESWPGHYLTDLEQSEMTLSSNKKSFYVTFEITDEFIEKNKLNDITPKSVKFELTPSREVLEKVDEIINKKKSSAESTDEKNKNKIIFEIFSKLEIGKKILADDWNLLMKDFDFLQIKNDEYCKIEKTDSNATRIVIYNQSDMIQNILEF